MAESSGKPYVGVDLGGTNINVGIVDKRDRVLINRKVRTKAQLGGSAVIRRMVDLVQEALDEANLKPKEVGGLGVGGPGATDVDKGLILNAPNLGWKRFDIAGALSAALNLPIVVDNDVNTAVYAEVRVGAAKGFDDVVGIWTGTGVGGAIVLGGKLYYGTYRTAGEVGHTILHPGAALGRRTLENCASRTAICRTVIDLIQAGHSSKVTKLVKGRYDRVRSKILAKAMEQGDELVCQVVRDAAHATGIAIANLVTTLSLPCVVLGGGLVNELGKTWSDWVRESVVEYVFPAELRSVAIVNSKLGDDAGIIGAAIVARERLGTRAGRKKKN